MIKRLLMVLVVLCGVVAVVGFFLPWIDVGASMSSAEHVSGWQIYNDYDLLFSVIVPGGAAIAVIFGLVAVIFPRVAVLKGIALSGALVAVLVAGGLYYGVTEAANYVSDYTGEGWLYIGVGYGLLVSLAGAAVAWLLSILGLIP